MKENLRNPIIKHRLIIWEQKYKNKLFYQIRIQILIINKFNFDSIRVLNLQMLHSWKIIGLLLKAMEILLHYCIQSLKLSLWGVVEEVITN